MWIVKVALDRPYTFIVLALLILILSPIVILRTPTDIFPNINIPVIAVAWQYTGLNPEEMEGRLTSVYERTLTTTVDNIEHIESTTVNGQAIVKVFLQPGADLPTANAQVTAISQTVLRQLPPGTLPPLIINYSASSVPILQLGLSGSGLSEQQLNDLGQNFIRPQLVTVAGAVIPWPYGGKQRQIMIDLYDYGPSCFDLRHNFRMSLLYHFPNLKSNGVLSKFVNGWWTGNIVSVQSGLPFTPILATNRSNSGNLSTGADRVDVNTQAIAQGTVLTNAEGGTYMAAANFVLYNPGTVITGNPNQWFNPDMFHMQPMVPCPNDAALTCGTLGEASRGILRGPGLADWDFSLVKDTAVLLLGKHELIQFRTEFFNILNRTNFGMPASATVFNGATSVLGAYQQAPLPGVGQITTTATTSRQIQFALKLIF